MLSLPIMVLDGVFHSGEEAPTGIHLLTDESTCGKHESFRTFLHWTLVIQIGALDTPILQLPLHMKQEMCHYDSVTQLFRTNP
jgi:hypothetical protein